MTRVCIADDHRLFADGLRDALEALPDFTVVGIAESADDLLRMLETETAHVAVVDWEMPGTGMRAVRALNGRVPTVVVTMHIDPETVRLAAEVGAVGFVSKSLPLAELAAVLRAAAAGTRTIGLRGDELTAVLEPYRSPTLDPGAASLTERERELLQLLARGVSATDELAEALYISQKTVKNHLASIFSKLAVSDRTQAAIEAIKLGLAKPK